MRKSQTAIPEDVKAFLRSGAFSPANPLHFAMPLTPDRKLYEGAKAVLARYGAPWQRHKKAHAFATEADRAAFEAAIASGVMRQDNAECFYPTPREVAEIVCDAVARVRPMLNYPDCRILEPSCGLGDLAMVAREYWPRATIIGVESDLRRAERARERRTPGEFDNEVFTAVHHDDFLAWWPFENYDAVVMNPPFTSPLNPRVWVEHVARAWRLVKPGGVLAAVLPGPFLSYTYPGVVELRRSLGCENGGCRVEPVEAGAFRPSGTDVSVVVVSAVKPLGG